MASPPQDAQDAQDAQDPPVTPHGRERRAWLLDIAVALLFLIVDAVIVVVAAHLLVMFGYGTMVSSSTGDVPMLVWLTVWGIPAVAATSAITHARLRMPITCVVQSLFTLACTFLALSGTRLFLS